MTTTSIDPDSTEGGDRLPFLWSVMRLSTDRRLWTMCILWPPQALATAENHQADHLPRSVRLQQHGEDRGGAMDGIAQEA